MMVTRLILTCSKGVNAFDYMLFARMVHYYSPTKKVANLSPSMLTTVFVCLDIVSFFIQLVGGGMAGPGSDPKTATKGVHIYMGGIGLQEFFIVSFLGLVIKFHRDMLKSDRHSSPKINYGNQETNLELLPPNQRPGWRLMLYVLYGSLLAITVRIIFRLIEFSRGFGMNNPLPHKEGYFYALEACPMLIAIALWNFGHPGRFLKGPDAKLPSSWISRQLKRICCCACCCGGRYSRRAAGKDGRGVHEKIGGETQYQNGRG